MRMIRTAIPEVLLLEPVVHEDERGFLLESFREAKCHEFGIAGPFVQDNHSRSLRGVLRGLHMQLRTPQGKLVTVVRGEVMDVAVDLRPESPTFGRHVSAVLSDSNVRLLWIPPGFAHGFCALSEVADVHYKCDAYYDPDDQIGVAWNDPELGIDWPIEDPVLSPRDRELPTLRDVRPLLEEAFRER
jgi:dTDP-4-dehydrorhamnose 3,5-epimerase